MTNKDELGRRLMSAKSNIYPRPVQFKTEARFCKITAGESHFVAQSITGTLYTWGIGEYGQLGRPFSENRAVNSGADLLPTQLYFGAGILDIYSGGFSTFVKTETGLYACGKNSFGELGLGDTKSRLYLQKVPFFDNHIVSSIAGGLHHTLVLTNKGLFGMGKNSDGQLGLGPNNEYFATPAKINLDNIEFIAAGMSSHHSYAIDSYQRLFVAGQNQYEQLGHSETIITTFKQVELKGRKCLDIAGGCQFTIANLSENA